MISEYLDTKIGDFPMPKVTEKELSRLKLKGEAIPNPLVTLRVCLENAEDNSLRGVHKFGNALYEAYRANGKQGSDENAMPYKIFKRLGDEVSMAANLQGIIRGMGILTRLSPEKFASNFELIMGRKESKEDPYLSGLANDLRVKAYLDNSGGPEDPLIETVVRTTEPAEE